MRNIDLLALAPQAVILVLGVTAMHLAASGTRRMRFRAGIVGLCNQPFWLVAMLQSGQYLIAVLCLIYGWAWLRMVLNNRRVA